MVKPVLNGIDISHHQRSINLSKVAADFVLCKATEGNGFTDSKFNDFAREIKALKRLRGFYHFARADLNPGTAGAKGEAAWFVTTVRPHLDGETLLVFDYEAGSLKAGTGWTKTWLDEVHRLTGIRALVYTSTSVVTGQDWSKIAPNHELWLANYGANPVRKGYAPQPIPKLKHWAAPAIHQYGDRGRLPGYSGDLDLNAAYIDAVQWRDLAKGKTVTKKRPYAVSPHEGRFTSGYDLNRYIILNGKRTFSPHEGVDIAPPVVGTVGTPVYAMFGGDVTRVVSNRKPGQPYTSGTVVHKYYSGNGIEVTNPDGERQLYIHVRPVVKKGQKVRPGDLIGYTDLSGTITGPHLHLTLLNKSGKSYDPMLAFNRWDIKIGSKPAYTSTVADSAPSTPAPSKPSKPSKPATSGAGKGLSTADKKAIQRSLKAMGYDVGPADGDYGNRTINAVKAYQKDLNRYAGAGLIVDGDWGPVLQGWFTWVKQLQAALPDYKGVPNLVVDGQYGPRTASAVKTLQSRNGLHVDGQAGPKTTAFMRKQGSKISNPPKNRP